MKKRVFIVHGYRSSPTDCWFPWLRKELEKKNFEVVVPRFTNHTNPKLSDWLAILKKEVGNADENTYFVGHSLGAVTIVRYLESLSAKEKVGGVVLIAGRFLLRKKNAGSTTDFFKKRFEWTKIKKKLNNSVGIYSIDDPYVSTENGRLLEKKLNAALILEKNKGHFSRGDAVTKIPNVLKSILSFIR